jgi:hypothetical protein
MECGSLLFVLMPGSATVSAAWMPAGRRRSQEQAAAFHKTDLECFRDAMVMLWKAFLLIERSVA